jgi:uncharacterized phiE125 gp8 family phage protein
MPVDPYALTTLDDVKLYLGITDTSQDALLGNLIEIATERIELMTGRKFKARNYTQWVWAANGCVQLANWPIISVKRVATPDKEAVTLSYSGTDIAVSLDVTDLHVRLTQTDANGDDTTTTSVLATDNTTNEVATTIGAATGMTATATVNVPSRWLVPNSGHEFVEDGSVNLQYASDSSPYDLDAGSGGIFVTLGNPRMVLVEYRGGYENVPKDVAQVANEFVDQIKQAAGSSADIQSERIGDYAYTKFPQSAQVQLSERQLDALARYCNIPVGAPR